MVLGGRPPGRVGRRRISLDGRPRTAGAPIVVFGAPRCGRASFMSSQRPGSGTASTTWTLRSLERPAYDARHEWASTGPGAAGRHADVPVLVDRGGVADADEQPRPRGGRAPRRPRGVRRDGPGGALVGGIRRDLRHAHDARRRRDDARAVRQAGRRVPHPRVGAPRAHRQLQPRARLGQLERVPPARGARADDVRPDDGRVVDLHRHAGHPAGHLRVLRRDRPAPLRRLARRHDHAHRRSRRHGRGPAAGGHDERRRGALRRRRRRPHRPPPRDPLPRRAGGIARRRHRPLRRRPRRAARPARSGWSATPHRSFPSCSSAASRPTSSPTRRAPTTR